MRTVVEENGPIKAGESKGKAYYKKDSKNSPRELLQINSVVLHHMAFNRGNNENSYVKVGAHYAVLADGKIIQLYDNLDYLNAANNFNRDSISIEFAGNFADIEYKWWKSKDAKNYDRCFVTPIQAIAGRKLLQQLKNDSIRNVYCHRQTSAAKRGDPGPDIFYWVGYWAIEKLSYNPESVNVVRGKDKKRGSPIPENWKVSRLSKIDQVEAAAKFISEELKKVTANLPSI